MKRTDISDLFPDATKEQIDKILNLNGADVNAAKSELQGLKDQIEALKQSQDGSSALAAELQAAKDKNAQLQTQVDGYVKAENIRKIHEKVSGEKNVPAHLLTGETEAACAKQADAILSFAKSQQGYPSVPDGGEPSAPPATSTREAFAKSAAENF